MLSEIPKDVPLVIDSIHGLIEKKFYKSTTIDAEKRDNSERIWIYYNIADEHAKSVINALFLTLCGKSLETLLKPEEPKETTGRGPITVTSPGR